MFLSQRHKYLSTCCLFNVQTFFFLSLCFVVSFSLPQSTDRPSWVVCSVSALLWWLHMSVFVYVCVCVRASVYMCVFEWVSNCTYMYLALASALPNELYLALLLNVREYLAICYRTLFFFSSFCSDVFCCTNVHNNKTRRRNVDEQRQRSIIRVFCRVTLPQCMSVIHRI